MNPTASLKMIFPDERVVGTNLLSRDEKISPRRNSSRTSARNQDGWTKKKKSTICRARFRSRNASILVLGKSISVTFEYEQSYNLLGQLGARIGYFVFRLRLPCSSDATDASAQMRVYCTPQKTQRIQPAINFALYGTRPISIFRFLLIVNRGVGEKKKCPRIKAKARHIIAAQQDDFLAG